jgi:catechol 2,3-dioxygenase-like lactoylglutathione lyase family enzyme
MHLKSAVRLPFAIGVIGSFLLPRLALAQLTPFNESGVTLGHVHLLVRDPEVHKKLWVDLFGAQVAYTGKFEFLKVPGMVVLLMKGQPSDEGAPTADHFAFLVRDLSAFRKKLAAASIQMPEGSSIATLPDGVRIEFIEKKDLTAPIAFHHFHLFAADADAIRAWYVKTFGGIKFPDAPNFPGGEMHFTAQANPPRVPTKGHPIDHISFEVKNLQEFCKKLEAQGTKLDMQIVDAPQVGLKVTFITDPIGTRIELTEGFAGK